MRKILQAGTVTLVALITLTAPASATPTASPTASGLADCTYRVTKTVKVYEKPTDISKHLTTKRRGDRVRGISWFTVDNEREQVRYQALDIKKAKDDIGWIDARALKLIRCDR